ncbi:MAG: S-layer homology domain-containing protein [Bacillota bacterium]
MFRRVTNGAVSLVIAACLLLSPQAVPAAGAASFKDTEGHWSRQVVEKSYALDLMKGYPGEVFKPEDPVTRLEAIAIIIRAMGLEEEARTVDYKNSGITLPAGMFWGQGHLVVAARKGLLHRDYVGQLLFGHPIPRQEVATLVAVALRDKLKTKGDPQKLAYTDTAEISPTYLPYVADVTQNNIMQGIENKQFGPNQIMKRGQMAALMVKTVQEGWFSYGSERIISGSVSALDSTAGVISITRADGSQIPRLIDTGAVFFRDSKPSSLADFKTGDQVTAMLGSNSKVRHLESSVNTAGSTDIPAETEITGKIVDRSVTGDSALKLRNTDFKETVYPLAQVVTITDGTGARGLSNLTDGTYVRVRVNNNSIHYIKILQSEEVTGEVNSILSGYFTVKTDFGNSRIFSVRPDDQKIVRGDSRLEFTDLKNGDRVKVTAVSGEAREITLITFNPDKAEIRAVDPFYRLIALTDDNSIRKEFEVELRASIRKGTRQISLNDLKPGDSVSIKVGGGGKVYDIYMEDSSLPTVYGTVTDVWVGSYPRIYVDSIKHVIEPGVPVTRNGASVSLRDIMLGTRVKIRVNDYNNVVSVEIVDDKNITVEGIVAGTNLTGKRITIEQSHRLEFTLPVNSNYKIYDQTVSYTNSTRLEDIRRGWGVKLRLNNGGIEEIRIVSR